MPDPAGVGPRRADERAYEQAIRRMVLSPIMGQTETMLRRAATLAEAIRAADAGLLAPFLDDPIIMADIDAIGMRIAVQHRERLFQQFRVALGVDVRPYLGQQRVTTYLLQWREANVALIKTIPPRYHRQLILDMTAHFAERPFDRGGLQQMLVQSGRSAGYNARRIARDQTNKAVGNLNQIRQMDIGIESYVWRTSMDERVRPTHRDKEGTVFRWDNPPPDTGHPGHDIQCRCRPQPHRLSGDRPLSDLRAVPADVPRAPLPGE